MRRGTTRQRLIVLVVVVQALALLSVAALHGVRLANGTEVRVTARPVDPLDLARGAYVDLRYDFEDLPLPAHTHDGDDVFITLQRPARGGDRPWKALEVTTDEAKLADADAFIRLPVQGRHIDTSSIGTSYESSDDAQSLQDDLADGGVVTLSLDRDGTPVVVDVAG